MYKLLPIVDGVESHTILKVNENRYIPINKNNRHYQEYLEWVAEGNTPEPADEV